MFDFNDFSFGLNLAAFLICLTDLIYTVTDKHTSKPQNKYYMVILGILAVNSLCSMSISVTEKMKHLSESAFLATYISRYVYFLTHSLLSPCFFFYISYVGGRAINRRLSWRVLKSRRNFCFDLVPRVSVVITEIIVALNPLLSWIWYFDEERNFTRAWGEFALIYSQGVLWMAAAFYLLMKSWNVLSLNRKKSITFCFAFALLGVAIQLLFSKVRVEVLMQSIGFTGVLLFVENEDDQKDVTLDAYNRPAFSLDISAAIRNKTPVQVILVRDIRCNQAAGAALVHTDSGIIDKAVSDYLGTKTRRYFIYALRHGCFAVIVYNRTAEEASRLADEVFTRFREPWTIQGTELQLLASVLMVEMPERAKTAEDLLYIAECPLPESAQKGVMQGDDLNWIVRYSAVESATGRGLSEGSFEVYYQPTYGIDKKPFGAEALIRMHDKEIGNVFPDEFIPVAERLGLIDDIDSFVLREVCRLLATGEPQKYGIHHINVNLSVIECMAEGFAEHIIETVESAGVEKSCISFEITESVAATDYDHLSTVIQKLRDAGFTFYIDDFGTGYSNISSLFSIGVDIIKIDKSLLWSAMDSELGMVLLSGTIKMVKEMRKRTLAEGVETEEQLALLRSLGCDYLQGYYFSRPLPEKEFLAHISGA